MMKELSKTELSTVVAGASNMSINRAKSIAIFYEYKCAFNNLSQQFANGKISYSRYLQTEREWSKQYNNRIATLNEYSTLSR